MKIYYRISDNSYPKIKLPGTDKRVCFENFKEVFANCDFHVIADNCKPETLDWLRERAEVEESSLGNAGSLYLAIDRACGLPSDEPVYFVEDDYLHRPPAPEALLEGLSVAEYVTLYDHPDKYTNLYNFGETSQVRRTKSSHWRYTVSTCMTFASTAGQIRKDYEVWIKHISGVHPNDHDVFSELGADGRRLGVCVPGLACHTDMTFSGVAGSVQIDQWAIEHMIGRLRQKISSYDDTGVAALLAHTLAFMPENNIRRLAYLASIAEILPK